MFPILFLFSDYALLVFRLALGLILVVHGWPKLKDVKGTGAWMGSVGFRPGMFWAVTVGVVEFFGGLALVAGLGVQIVAALVALEFAVISIWKIAKRQPFKMGVVEGFVGGWEYDFLILASSLALLALGGGMYSLNLIL